MRVSPDGPVTPLAGGACGFADGERDQGKFGDLHGATMRWGANGHLYIAENFRVREITPEGLVTTLAGGAESGYVDGPGAQARFGSLAGLAVDKGGHVFVADRTNFRIRRITPDGHVSTLAGSGKEGHRDGKREEATFQDLSGIAVDAVGNLYVLELVGPGWIPRVRKITPDGQVSTLADAGSRN